MSKRKQNLIFLFEPLTNKWDITIKAGKMYLNRFLIDEEAACECSGVYYLKKSSWEMSDSTIRDESKGKDSLEIYTFARNDELYF